jgi:hypothetical protein
VELSGEGTTLDADGVDGRWEAPKDTAASTAIEAVLRRRGGGARCLHMGWNRGVRLGGAVWRREGGLRWRGTMWQEEEGGGGSDVASSGGSRSGTPTTGGQAWLLKIEEVGR